MSNLITIFPFESCELHELKIESDLCESALDQAINEVGAQIDKETILFFHPSQAITATKVADNLGIKHLIAIPFSTHDGWAIHFSSKQVVHSQCNFAKPTKFGYVEDGQ